jgi:hypothetical protein
MPSAEASGARCVQNFDGSRNSAIHTTYRISLRSSSIREPRYPLLRVVIWFVRSQKRQAHKGATTTTTKTLQRHKNGGTLECVPRDVCSSSSTDGACTQRRNHHHHHHNNTQSRKNKTTKTVGHSRCVFDRFNDPSAGSPTETLLRLLLPLGGRV